MTDVNPPKDLLLGTAGWERPGWAARYYPDGMPADWRLDYYANDCDCVLLTPEDWRSLDVERFVGQLNELPPTFRGKVVIVEENCKGCGLCVRDCPANGLILQRNGKTGFRLIHYPDRCAYCAQCEDNCRSDAIHLTNEYVHATTERGELMHVLVERWDGDDRRRTTGDA